MKKLIAEITGKTNEDLIYGLEETLANLKIGISYRDYTYDDGSYKFEVSEMEE